MFIYFFRSNVCPDKIHFGKYISSFNLNYFNQPEAIFFYWQHLKIIFFCVTLCLFNAFSSTFLNCTYALFLNTMLVHGCHMKFVISEKLNLFRQHLRQWFEGNLISNTTVISIVSASSN